MDKNMMPNADSTYELPQGGIAGLGAVGNMRRRELGDRSYN